MEIVIHRGANSDGIGNEDSFGFFVHRPIKGIRFRHAIGNIADGAILLHGREHTLAHDVSTVDFFGTWDAYERLHFTIARFLDDCVGGVDNRIEVLISEDGDAWTLAAWLEEFV